MPGWRVFSGREAASALMLGLSLAACSSRAQRAERAAASYTEAIAAGDYPRARLAMLQAVAQRDDVASYWISLGQVDLKLNDYPGAYDAYSHAMELQPKNLEALHNVAEISLAAKRYDDATKHARTILKIDPQDARAQLVLGYVALRQKHYAQALQWGDRILTAYPLQDPPLVLKAMALFGTGQRPEAIGLIEHAIPIRGASELKLDTLLDFYRDAGNPAGVEQTLMRYIQLQPDNIGMKLRYAAQLYRNGKPSDAENVLVPMLAAGQVPDRIADVMVEYGGNSPSQALLQRLSSNAPAPVAAAIARVALDKGYPDLAMHLVAPYIGGAMTPTVAAAAGLFAAAKLAVGRDDEALGVAQRVLAFDNANSRALQVRGEISLRRHNLNQALSDARVLVRDYPNAPENRVLLARVYEARGDVQLAQTILGDALNDLPASTAVLEQYIALLTHQKRLALAADLARKFTERNPDSAQGWKALADLCRATGDSDCVAQSMKAQTRLEMAHAPSQAAA